MIEENKNINEILIEGAKYLKSKSIDNSDNEIQMLLLHLLSCSKIELFYKKHENLSKLWKCNPQLPVFHMLQLS